MSEQTNTAAYNWTGIVAIIIATVSLGVSLYGTLRPAQVKFGFNKVALSALGGVHFAIPVMIANFGARPYIVEDMLLIEDDGTSKATYTCWFTVKPDRFEHFLMTGPTPGKASDDVEGQFAPFTVFGDSQTSKLLVFNLYSGKPLYASSRELHYTLVLHTTVGDFSSIADIMYTPNLGTTLQHGGAEMNIVKDSIGWRDAADK